MICFDFITQRLNVEDTDSPTVHFLFSFWISFIFNLEKENGILFPAFYGLKSHKTVEEKNCQFFKG